MPESVYKGILQPFTEVFDRAWEWLIYDVATPLTTLFEPSDIDAKWIRLLAPLLGFTPDMSFNPSVAELRRILSVAAEYWNDKPTEQACINDAIRMVTGNRFRAGNYFDFRSQIDWTVLTEELMDFDPYAIGFPSDIISGGGGQPDSANTFIVGNYEYVMGTKFQSRTEWQWLVVTLDHWSSNEGIYKIAECEIGTERGSIEGTFPSPYSGEGKSFDWKLFGYMQEFVSEARVVDPGVGTLAYDAQIAAFNIGETVTGETSGATGVITADEDVGTEGVLSLRSINGRFEDNEPLCDETEAPFPNYNALAKGELVGVLNRELLRFLMGSNDNTVRPMGERIDVVYINFLDQFNTQDDLTQWTQLPDDDGITVGDGDGYAQFTASYELLDADTQSEFWADQCTAWKITADTTSSIVDLVFYATDEDDHYFVRVDYSAKTVRLYKKVATVDTAIGSAVSILGLIPDFSDVIRVDVATNGSDMDIRVKVNGEMEIDETDSPAAHTAGGVGARAQASTFKLELVEVNVLPAELDRVGPMP